MNIDIDINIVIPAAGLGSRFSSYGFKKNKFLLPVDINLTNMLEQAILTLIMKHNNLRFNFVFIMRKSNNNDLEIEEKLRFLCKKNNSEFNIKWIDYLTEGPATTSYLIKDLINNDKPLIISNSDQILDWNFDKFLNKCKQYDGCVLTYIPPYEFEIGSNDKHSFVKFDKENNPIEFVEKIAISKEALVGVHYYKTTNLFIESYEYLFKNNIRAPNGEFYLSYTYQALLNMKYKVGTYKLENNEFFYPVGEPIDYFNYYNNKCAIKKYNLINDTKKTIINNLNKYSDYFTINFNNSNEKITIINKLFIVIKGKTNVDVNIFISNNREITFLESTYYILFNLNSKNIINKDIVLNEYKRGWILGNFIPSIEINKDIEIGYLCHLKNSIWDFHYHKESIEINFLVKGKMKINNIEYNEQDIFTIEKNIVSCPLFTEDCYIICIKIPSQPYDKYIV
jgi:NDP-sugar pyrophosphorylase family protein